jgi:DNA-binding response OmpR family regulator
MDDFGSWAKIVIVEDEAALADIYKTRLELLGYVCFVASQGIEALEVIERERPSLVLLDIMIPKVAGDQILKVIRASDWGKDIKVLVISNLNEADAPAGIREQGIEGYAVKANLSNDQLDAMVDRILKPSGQNESVSLETDPETVVTDMEPVAPPAESSPQTEAPAADQSEPNNT